jgi:hypothetical protein
MDAGLGILASSTCLVYKYVLLSNPCECTPKSLSPNLARSVFLLADTANNFNNHRTNLSPSSGRATIGRGGTAQLLPTATMTGTDSIVKQGGWTACLTPPP